MPAPVFYSVCPFGTGTIETGAGNISITSGVATLTVEQTGNIGAGVCIEYNSLSCYIAPNRIGFDSGGTTELLLDTKISGATSSATGIIRFVEVTSGTWAGGDAAGWIYFESTTGTFQNNENVNRTKPTVSNNIATINGTIEGNIGNGNTQFVVKSATGGTPANQSATAVTSVHHEYASLSTFEAGFTDSSHVNNTSLVAADVVAHACCYYDHNDYTADTAGVSVAFGTADAVRYLVCYTPVGEAESVNKQRHAGKWDANKYKLETTNNSATIYITQGVGTHIEGLQVLNSGSDSWNSGIDAREDYVKIEGNIVRITGTPSSSGNGIYIVPDANIDYIYNNVVYDICNNGIYNAANAINSKIQFNTVSDCGNFGMFVAWITNTKNNAVFNNPDDFRDNSSPDYCASDDGDGTNAVDWTVEATDWGNVFADYANADFSLNNFTGTGTIIEQGTDLSSDGIWRDIAGNERGSTPDIGAFEYVAAAATGNPWNYYAQQ